MWYSAALLFQSVHNDSPTEDDIWELQIVVIQARTDETAGVIANDLGKDKEHEYLSATGDRVRWVFRNVESITELSADIKDGTEVYARFLRTSDVKSLLTPIDTRPNNSSPDARSGPKKDRKREEKHKSKGNADG